MLIVLNGYPGVGKLSVGQELIKLLDGRLLDIHSVYNVAFAVTEIKSPAFYDTVRAVQKIAYARILELPEEVPVVFTDILTEGSEWVDECWSRIIDLSRARGPMFMVHLHCELEENKRRIQSEGRNLSRKPTDPEMAQRNHDGGSILVGRDLENFFLVDSSDLSAVETASVISEWIKSRS